MHFRCVSCYPESLRQLCHRAACFILVGMHNFWYFLFPYVWVFQVCSSGEEKLMSVLVASQVMLAQVSFLSFLSAWLLHADMAQGLGSFVIFWWISDKFPIHFLYISFISPVHFLYISSIFLSYFLPTSLIFPWHFLHIPFIFPPFFFYISLRCPRYVLRISSTAEITNTCLVPSDWTLQGSSLSSTQFPARSFPIPS